MCPPTLLEAIFKTFFKYLLKPSFVTNFSIHPYIPKSVDTQQAHGKPKFLLCYFFLGVHITYRMLFWNNDIKAVVVVGTNIADNELQHEYTVGIFPILRTPYRLGV